MAEMSNMQLVEKIVRAKVKVEGLKKVHTATCAAEEPEGRAPCNCGASAHNATIDSILEDLALE